MNLKQRDIVLLPFPFSDLRQRKVRPALVFSQDTYNKQSVDCIMLPLTSVIKKDKYSVIIEQVDLEKGDLIKTSRVKIDKIFSIEKKRAIKNIGRLSKKTFRKIKMLFLSELI